MKITALVTGATGFIGSHLCNWLHSNNYKVYAIGIQKENRPKCEKLFKVPVDEIPWHKLPNIDVCFHQAANNNTTDSDFESMYESNVNQTIRLFDLLHNLKNCKKFVYASSCSIYGKQPAPYIEEKTRPNPLNAYAQSKLLLEEYAEQFSEENDAVIVGLRYTNVFGPNEGHKKLRASMIHQIIETVVENKQPNLFKWGEQKRDWVYIDDVVNANILASKAKKSAVYNVGSGKSEAFIHLLQFISKTTGKKIKPIFKDCPFEAAYQKHVEVDLSLIKKELGYKPKWSVDKGIQDMYKKRDGK